MRWAETRVETEGKRRTLLVKAIFPIAGKTDVFSFPRKDPPVGTSWPFLVCLFKAATRAPSLIPIIHFYLETKFRVTRSQFAADLLGKGPDSGVDYLFHCEGFNDVKRIREEGFFLRQGPYRSSFSWLWIVYLGHRVVARCNLILITITIEYDERQLLGIVLRNVRTM